MTVVAPVDQLRSVLAEVASSGMVEVERLDSRVRGRAGQALERAHRRLGAGAASSPSLSAEEPDLASLEAESRLEELAGEAELEQVAGGSLRHGSVAAVVGWCPASSVGALAQRLGGLGGALVTLRVPAGIEPPTLIEGAGATAAFQPLVDTYSTVGYRDLNPSALAGIAYVLMFGMMFADVGHGALVLTAGLLMLLGRPGALARLRNLAPFVIGAGLASMLFGLAFGEAFGPTRLVPTLWLSPLDHATTLLAVAIGAGGVLLAGAYVLGAVNRWREGGPFRALAAISGIAGAALYFGLALVGLGWYEHSYAWGAMGALLAVIGLALGFTGMYQETGGMVATSVGMFDAVVRIGTNTISFARLAAFGLTHAALSSVTWHATDGLWHRGSLWVLLATIVFVLGNAVAFGLEGLVAGVQALRLEYYELFSRIFIDEGRRFRPWHIPLVGSERSVVSVASPVTL